MRNGGLDRRLSSMHHCRSRRRVDEDFQDFDEVDDVIGGDHVDDGSRGGRIIRDVLEGSGISLLRTAADDDDEEFAVLFDMVGIEGRLVEEGVVVWSSTNDFLPVGKKMM